MWSGDTYIGIKGEKVDGSELFEKAFENGAKACIIEGIQIKEDIIKKYPNNVIIKVNDTIDALQKIAVYKREMYDIPVIGVTGSVGKTSTKDLVSSVMSMKYKTLKTSGNYNNHIGVPLTVLSLKDHTAAVVEMGMNHLGEISVVSKISKPTMSIITNVRNSTYWFLRLKREYIKGETRDIRWNERRCSTNYK